MAWFRKPSVRMARFARAKLLRLTKNATALDNRVAQFEYRPWSYLTAGAWRIDCTLSASALPSFRC